MNLAYAENTKRSLLALLVVPWFRIASFVGFVAACWMHLIAGIVPLR